MIDPPTIPGAASLTYVEGLYADYFRDPASVPPEWQQYFAAIADADPFRTNPRTGPAFRPSWLFDVRADRADRRAPSQDADVAALQERVDQLVHAYRVRGHLIAQIDPLGMARPHPPELEPEFHGLTESDLDRPFSTEAIQGADIRTLRDILTRLRNTYCRSIGVQFMHIDSLTVKQWLQTRMEGTENRLNLTRPEQLRILTRLTDAVVFEDFLQKKFVGAKSFSLQGAESLIPLLDLAIEKAGEQGLSEIVLGMAHRGRLNVLVNIIGKSPKQIFREFADLDSALYVGRGDVKYHLGYSSDRQTASGRSVHLSLTFNPSHLEYVNPVAVGRMRAKQDRWKQSSVPSPQSSAPDPSSAGMTLLIHGDAAFAGEGIVQETLNMSQLDGYTIGGTLHVVVNNLIGFTTPPAEGRSSVYATDVAKLLQSPIFHVNGEDPEAVAQVVRLAMDFRLQFKRDVVIDMYCYRRQGHNEGDEPSFTQPLLYRAIQKRKSVREGYLDHLLALQGITREEADQIVEQRKLLLEKDLTYSRSQDYTPSVQSLTGLWKGYHGGPETPADDLETGVNEHELAELLESQTRLPADFHPNPKIERFLKARAEMARGERPLDWSAGEALAFASLATQGHRVRLSGQDSARGTFSQRHAVLHDIENGRTYMPLAHLTPDQAPVETINSPLSEAGVLGFEYGYSLDCPDGLVCWEAQFGDFVNAAQVIVDQFVASAERKWYRLSGLVLLLPHGFEGQGPEHSSARLERFLALSAEENMQIVFPTTPAQYFHVLRRQVLRKWLKPLVVMTPKSLLRHPEAVSNRAELAGGRFRRVIPDDRQSGRAAGRVLMCAGKIYYELREHRAKAEREDVDIVRLEQLYPLPLEELRAALAGHPDGTPVFWVQEEPENMGAWRFLRIHFGESLFERLPFAGITRPAAASPATGSHSSHKIEQEQLLERALGREAADAHRAARAAPERKNPAPQHQSYQESK